MNLGQKIKGGRSAVAGNIPDKRSNQQEWLDGVWQENSIIPLIELSTETNGGRLPVENCSTRAMMSQ